MQTTINWNEPLIWLTGLVLLAMLVVQAVLILRNRSVSGGRKWLRFGLNLLLWLVLLGYFLQLRWTGTRESNRALLVGTDVPAAVARRLSDSLRIETRFGPNQLLAGYDSVTVVGQDFPVETLTRLSGLNVQWIPYSQPNQLQSVRWQGMIRQGETQRITGRINTIEQQWLRVQYGRKTLDSVRLQPGNNAFTLSYPAFTRGQTQVELSLSQPGNARTVLLDTLRSFTRATRPLTVQFLLSGPDFESKTLANWLGKQGHTVQLSASISTNIGTSLSINKATRPAGGALDLLITEPTQATNPAVRKAVAGGRAVLFINLSTPETDCRLINQSTGTRWQVRKISNEASLPMGANGLSALPYRFADAANQLPVAGVPVAVQQSTGRVGISLLNETFPLALSGDSVAYSRIWTAVLARLSGPEKNNVLVDAPVFSGMDESVLVNNVTARTALLRVGQDTIPLSPSPLNDRSADGVMVLSQPGWQTIQDSLSLYIRPGNADEPLAQRARISQFAEAHALTQTTQATAAPTTINQVPNWLWLVLLLICFTLLWVEPKF